MRRALVILLCTCARVWASDYVLIANPGLQGISVSYNDMRQVFLGTRSNIAGRRVEPVIARSGEAHKRFASTCLGKTEAGLNNYFRMQVFSGKGVVPRSFSTAAEIVEYVAKAPGAIGYVDADTELAGVVVLEPR